jgi:homoserine dehydrogenase
MSFSTSKAPKTVSVSVVGVGLVGSEFLHQLQALPSPHPFRLISLSSSKKTVLNADGIPPSADWRALLRASSAATSEDHVADLQRRLPTLVRADNAVVFVDNTASASVAETYPALLRAGVHVVTPNKKAFSGSQDLYDQIVDASREGGAKFLHEATVGAGLPVLSTLKDLVGTGDKVRSTCMHVCMCMNAYAFVRARGPCDPHSHHDTVSPCCSRRLLFSFRLLLYLSLALALG